MFRRWLFVLFALSLALTACSTASLATPAPSLEAATAAPPPSPTAVSGLSFIDGLGREVHLASPAQRIVSLAPSTTEILFAVGAGDQIVGRDSYSDYPEAVKNVADIGSTYGTLNTEAIVALKPDLVVAAGINSPEQIKALEDLQISVYLFANPEDFDELFQQLKIAGQLTGHEKEAEALVASLATRVNAVTEKVKNATTAPTVFYEIDGSDPGKPWTTGPGTFMDTLIRLAGGKNIGAGLSDAFAQLSAEEILQQDPDFILLGDAKFGVTVESVGQRPGWANLSAVKNGRVVAFNDDLASRPGPRLVEGLETLARILHPELFE